MRAKQVNQTSGGVNLGQHRSGEAPALNKGGVTRWQALKGWLRLAGYRRWLRRRNRTTPVIPPRTATTVDAAGLAGTDAPTAWRKSISR